MSSVIETEPAVIVISNLWDRFGEGEGAGGETSHIKMETERVAQANLNDSRGGLLPTPHRREQSLRLRSAAATTSPPCSVGGLEDAGALTFSGCSAPDLEGLPVTGPPRPLSKVCNECCGPVVLAL